MWLTALEQCSEHLSWHYVEVMVAVLVWNQGDSAPIELPKQSRLGLHVALLLVLLATVVE